MSDAVTTAKTARESLARALGALQSDPGVPPQLMAVADPVSQAMGALFQIERSGGAATAQHAPAALDAVRRALAMLQAQPSNHPAVGTALESVAGSLGLVHGLTRVPPTQPDPQPVAPPAYAQPQAPQPYQAPQQQFQPPPQQPYQPPQQAAYQPPIQQQPAPWQPQPPAQPAPQPQYQPPQQQYQPPPQQQHQPAPQPAYQQPAQPQFQPPPQQQFQAPPQQQLPPQQQQQPYAHAPAAAPLAAPADAIRVEAELGTHSASNFYKGLSGNDIIEHGGLFVATYNIPRIGQSVALHVSMPGGYEFEAVGVVRWTRETVDSSVGGGAGGSPPGFGAQLTQVSPDARQLVMRYVRNREPLFHDDL